MPGYTPIGRADYGSTSPAAQSRQRLEAMLASGPWQTDAELLRLFRAAQAETQSMGADARYNSRAHPALDAYSQYLDANRERLGIPTDHNLDPATGGQTLRNNHSIEGPLGRAGIAAGAALVGGVGIPALLGAGAAPASGALTNTAGIGSITGPAAIASQGASAGIPLGGLGAAGAAAGAVGNAANGAGVVDKIRNALTSGEGIASLAALIPALVAAGRGGGGNNAGTTDELRRMQGITEAQMRRADPLHQVAVQLAYGRAPISARNGVSLQNIQLPPQG